jgi:hypothetical protein
LWWAFFESLDLTSNDTISATSEDYINWKKRLVISEASSELTSKAVSTNILNNPPKYTFESLDLTANDTISTEDYIKKLIINEASSSKTSKATATNSMLNNPTKYNSQTSTPLQEPQYVHKMLQSPSWRCKKIDIKKSNENTLSTTSSTSIVLPSLDSDYDFVGISPPVTIQFSVAPSKLLKTPAKEAAKLIVDELVSCLSPDITTPSNSNKDGFNSKTNTISSLFSDINRRYQIYSPDYKTDRVHVNYVGEKLSAKRNDPFYQVKSALAQSKSLGYFAAGGSKQQVCSLFASDGVDDDESDDDVLNSPCPAGPVKK